MAVEAIRKRHSRQLSKNYPAFNHNHTCGQSPKHAKKVAQLSIQMSQERAFQDSV